MQLHNNTQPPQQEDSARKYQRQQQHSHQNKAGINALVIFAAHGVNRVKS